jgi:exosortase family protein XrtG
MVDPEEADPAVGDVIMLIALAVSIYVAGLVILRTSSNQLLRFIWGAPGFAFLTIWIAVDLNVHHLLAAQEANQLQWMLALSGNPIDVINHVTLLVPDDRGWVGMTIGAESSTLIELAVFLGVVLFYPKLGRRNRLIYGIIGVIGTYLLNLLRLLLIIALISIWGREVFPLAHSVIGRTVYFLGVVALYWYLLTKPTLRIIQHRINES